MKEKGISQETLKLIACITMLIDHVGAVFFPGSFLRTIGRISFPIYCYLLTEGVFYTKNRSRYGKRLFIGILLAEIPFDFLFYGRLYWGKQSVMLTLFLGYLFCVAAMHIPGLAQRMLLLIPFAYLGELLHVDYGAWGVIMIGMFMLTKDQPKCRLQQVFWLAVISLMISKVTVTVGPLQIPRQLFSLLALIPIFAYDGSKRTHNVWIQRGFYLFYPVHLALLYLLRVM